MIGPSLDVRDPGVTSTRVSSAPLWLVCCGVRRIITRYRDTSLPTTDCHSNNTTGALACSPSLQQNIRVIYQPAGIGPHHIWPQCPRRILYRMTGTDSTVTTVTTPDLNCPLSPSEPTITAHTPSLAQPSPDQPAASV